MTPDTPRCQVTINGAAHEFTGPPHCNALDFLRSAGFTSCKEGCAEGECGACAILVARPDGPGTRWNALNACMLPAAALDGQQVITAEGLGMPGNLHPVQQQMVIHAGSQCGYCTPGFICAMAAEYYRPERATDPQPASEWCGPNGFELHALSGNLCRCTGYRPIREAAWALNIPQPDDELAKRTGQPAPPPLPTDLSGPDTPTGEPGRYRRPATLDAALDILAHEPHTVPVAGCTDWGVEVNIKRARARSVLAIDRLEELRQLQVSDDHIRIGSALTLSELERLLAGRVPLLEQLLPHFASRLIRNSATLGGNLGTGSPIGDSPPVLLALDAELVLASINGERVVPLREYFTGYRQTVRQPGELIIAIRIPLPLANVVGFQKISKRRFDDISSVAIGCALHVRGGFITGARLGLGGVAATPLRALATEAALEGKPFTGQTLLAAARIMAGEGSAMDDHRASAAYRRAMLGNFLPRLFATGQGGDAP